MAKTINSPEPTDESLYHIEGCNIPPELTIHPTSHPKVFFAGGDLFGRESLSRFDGFVAFAERGAFQWYAGEVLHRGWLKCPYQVHFDSIPLTELGDLVQMDLNYLVNQGCRTIGIHAPSSINDSKIAVQAAVNWLETHSDSVDSLFFVDAQDDYFNCFGTNLPV